MSWSKFSMTGHVFTALLDRCFNSVDSSPPIAVHHSIMTLPFFIVVLIDSLSSFGNIDDISVFIFIIRSNQHSFIQVMYCFVETRCHLSQNRFFVLSAFFTTVLDHPRSTFYCICLSSFQSRFIIDFSQ